MKTWMKMSMAAALAAAALVYGGCSGSQPKSGAGSASGKPIIGVVQIVQHGSLDQANKGFVDGLKERGYGEDKVTFDQQNAQGDQSNLKTIASRFKSETHLRHCYSCSPGGGQ